MADKRGGYLRPCISNNVTADYDNHRYERTPPSREPGTDYGVAYGSSIRAAEDGIVAYVDHSTAGAEGRRVCVKHSDGQMTSDIHLSRILVHDGQKVTRGQEIGKSGASAWGREWGVGAHVHRTLFPTHSLTFGTTRTLDFQKQEGADNDIVGVGAGSGVRYDQATANVQASLNRYRGEKLIVDGLRGPATTAAIKRLQTFLRVKVDGVWGPVTNSAYNAWVKKTQPAPKPQGRAATVADLAKLRYVNGLQKIAKLYGYAGKIDNAWGPGSKAGFQKFLNQNHGGSLATWLRGKWGYVGNDVWGPVMAAAAARAENANWKALG